ncbi:hypothetical protein B0I27_101429 [Arcticibacter pallidicorallinus]|uniref:Uncharacterized protein n=1 Tax=Arcticibacter pallidicorallinus TaxID=1259464 RepID=A0A2T0UC62_9SPHI|nr:hypothetical protein [Arcticibacter pallidicorallinus]PRY55458.1 hypothetical protein B0I27_101429 [Arcticibacter pallidicorallinus]
MRIKTFFIILITVLVTIVLMNNTEEIDMWLFGTTRISKLIILAVVFVLGFIVGALIMRPRKKKVLIDEEEDIYPEEDPQNTPVNTYKSKLSDEDRDYIS